MLVVFEEVQRGVLFRIKRQEWRVEIGNRSELQVNSSVFE